MIQRYQNSTAMKCYNLAGTAFMHVLLLGALALGIAENSLLGTLLFGGLVVYLLQVTYTNFIQGRIHEVYLLSGRTLAILHPRRPTRYLKSDDIVAYRARFGDFKLQDGSKLRFGLINPDQNISDELVARWYGEEAVATYGLGGMLNLHLSSEAADGTILRFPKQRPNIARYVAGYIVLLILPILVVALPVASIARVVPFDRDMALLLTVLTALFQLPVITYLSIRCTNLFLRGDLYTTVLLSPNTVAIVRPRRRTRYINRQDFVAYLPSYQPSSGKFLLNDDSRVGFGFVDAISPPPGATLTLRRRWWPYVPLNQWTLSPFRGFAILGVASVGLMMLILGVFEAIGSLAIAGVVVLASATGYLIGTILGIAGVKTVPLRPEFYPRGLPRMALT